MQKNWGILLQLHFFVLHLDIFGIKCAVKLLYYERNGSFSSLSHLKSKWAVCGLQYETSLKVMN